MARYRLIAGQHEQDDRSRPITGPDGKPTGRFHSQTFTATKASHPVVESDVDLVAKLGRDKFELIDDAAGQTRRVAELEAELARLKARSVLAAPGTPTPENLTENPAHAPGGQVSTGWQDSGGPMAPEKAKELLAQQAGQQPSGGKAPAAETFPAVKGQKAASREEYHERLDGLTVAELREHAEAEEIDLAGAHRRDDVLRAIKAAK